MNKWFSALLAVSIATSTFNSTFAQTSDELTKCRALDGDASRLACYDQLKPQAPASAAPETTVPDETNAALPQASQESWTGTGIRNLPPFNEDGAWTLHWQSSGEIGITVKNAAGQDALPVDVASSSDGNADSSYETVTGPIYLSVNAFAPWGVWVTPAN